MEVGVKESRLESIGGPWGSLGVPGGPWGGVKNRENELTSIKDGPYVKLTLIMVKYIILFLSIFSPGWIRHR